MLILESLADGFRIDNPALANSRTERRDPIPLLGAHVFGPEGPGAALCRASFVDRATVAVEEYARRGARAEVKQAVKLRAIPAGELPSRHIQCCRESPPVLQRDEYVSIRTVRYTTLATSLAGKAHACLPPWFGTGRSPFAF